MTDLNKFLKEKLEAKDYEVNGGYTWTSDKGVISVGGISGNNINTTWTALDEVRADLKQLDYILQRIVPNYDELVAQYRAIKDIEEAGE